MRRFCAGVCLLALSLGLLACGGEERQPAEGDRTAATSQGERLTKVEYERRVKAAFASVEQSTRGKQDLAQLEAAIAALDRLTAELQRIRPPAEIDTAHRDYTNGIRALVELKRAVVRAAAEGDQKRALELSRKNLPPAAVERVQRARMIFERLDYDIGGEPLGN